MSLHATGQDLAEVLDAVRTATGVDIEFPPLNAAEPVFLRMGPSSVRDVMVALLEGTRYNYILLGSAKDPQRVERVIASLQSSPVPGAAGAAAGAAEAPAAQATLYGGQGARPDPDAEDNSENSGFGQQLQPAQIPSSVPTGIDIQQLATKEGKTAGQILDELQKRQLEVLDQQLANQPPQ